MDFDPEWRWLGAAVYKFDVEQTLVGEAENLRVAFFADAAQKGLLAGHLGILGSEWTSSKSPARKAASAMIAKIPLPLARHIAATFRPCQLNDSPIGRLF